MNIFKKIQIMIPFLVFIFLFVSPVLAAAPDGLGPWADSVVSTSQGLMKNGSAVPAIRSDSTAALGVAENDTVDSHFYSLGFGGNIVLGFDNGISSGILIIEATNPNYPLEKAKVEVSDNGTTWMNAGTVVQDGTVNIPEGINCAKFVRITDISNTDDFSDATADGYDVDGAQAVGETCTPAQSPTPTPGESASPTPTPQPSTSVTSVTSNTPGFPNAGGPSCTAGTITTVPNIISAHRVSPTSIFISWGPDGGLSNFVVHYGFQSNNLPFSTNVSGFSTTINDLPANQSIWVQVAATDNCTTGTFGTLVLVGGTVITNSPGFPNTGNTSIPRLPNTGIGSDENIIDFILSIISNVINKL